MNADTARQFDGQVAIVTGAAQGIGLATAELLAGEGAAVVMTDIDARRLHDAASRLTDKGLDTTAETADLTDEGQVAAMADATIQRHGHIDVLVSLAAIYPLIPFDQLTLADWHKVMAANVDSTFLCARAVLPHMRARGYGRIINTTSGTFQRPDPGMSAYVTSKGAIIGFTRQLACEAGDGITVNAVSPGLIATEHTLTMLDDDGMTDALFDRMVGHQSVKRRGQPADVAQCIAYIASREASFITGQIFNVNGGSTLN